MTTTAQRWYGAEAPQPTPVSNRDFLVKLTLAHELGMDVKIAEHEAEMDRLTAEHRERIAQILDGEIDRLNAEYLERIERASK